MLSSQRQEVSYIHHGKERSDDTAITFHDEGQFRVSPDRVFHGLIGRAVILRRLLFRREPASRNDNANNNTTSVSCDDDKLFAMTCSNLVNDGHDLVLNMAQEQERHRETLHQLAIRLDKLDACRK